MEKAIKVLWIEEETSENLELLRIQMELDDRIDLQVAGNAREACEFLKWNLFDVVLVDIILPPGIDKKWIEIRLETEKLGFELIQMIFKGEIEILTENNIAGKFGVFTIERLIDIIDLFDTNGGKIKVENYRNKDSIHDGEELIKFIFEIYNSWKV